METRTNLFRVTTPPMIKRRGVLTTENITPMSPTDGGLMVELAKAPASAPSRRSKGKRLYRSSTVTDQMETLLLQKTANFYSNTRKPKKAPLSPRTASIPEPLADDAEDDQSDGTYYFQTGFKASDFVDSAKHPPLYKEQFTVTGQVRKVKLKRSGEPLGKKVELNGKTIAVFRYKLNFYAVDNTCCHQGGPLCEGDIEDLTLENDRNSVCVTCPWHGWKFKLDSGECTHTEDYIQTVYPCKVNEENEVLVGFKGFCSNQFDKDLDF